jgi:RIO kinase 1
LQLDELQPALDEGWIKSVLRAVKSGKEASVYLCLGSDRSGERLVAAKVYRPRRTFSHDAEYWDGATRHWGRRLNVAAAKRTSFGREMRFGGWIQRELEALRVLHAAGALVPRPIAVAGGALLLSWIGDEDGAAPPLHSVRADAPALDTLVRQVELFLAHDVVHGDLSEYNVLVWDGRPVVIDFPQSVDPRFNRAARSLLERDLRNLASYFGRIGVAFDWRRRSAELWSRWLNSELGRDETPAAEDWEFWSQFV